MEKDYAKELARARELVEARVAHYFPGNDLQAVMAYSLLAGGKRIRPILTMKFCQAAGGEEGQALDFGCGVEMLHTYSLIHDDLPCMDNDDLRRGKPTCHKVYGQWQAMLAGDALQAAAFETVLAAPECTDSARAQAARILAKAAGEQGMCGGQYYDILGDGRSHTEEELTAINDAKTGALLRAACMMGAVAACGKRPGDQQRLQAAQTYATHLGLAFQIRDDILDATSTAETFGKSVGSDAANGKTTYFQLLGLAACEKRVEELTHMAKSALDKADWPGGTGFLCWLADQLAHRDR